MKRVLRSPGVVALAIGAVIVLIAVAFSARDKGKATLSQSDCTPSGTGTTDLATKPVVTVLKDAAPAQTTNIDIVCGGGTKAAAGSKVALKYVGVLYADGSEFDSSWKVSPGNTFSFTIGTGQVIPGFDKGATGMRVGGRREVIIPAADGYGAQGSPPVIPPNAPLIFVIDLVSVG
jgi:peptidylprolyl isomerase